MALSKVLAVGCALVALAGCGSTPEEDTGSVDQWLGDSAHLAISGTFEGKNLDTRLEGEAASSVYCNRVYAPLPGSEPDAEGKYDTSQVYFVFREIGGIIDVDGTATEFAVSHWRHEVPAGTDMPVVPRVYGTAIAAGETWSDINLFEPGTASISGVESAALSGTVSVELYTGVPDAGGIFVPEGGRAGGFWKLSWGPNDNLTVSATADCRPSQLLTWPQARLVP